MDGGWEMGGGASSNIPYRFDHEIISTATLSSKAAKVLVNHFRKPANDQCGHVNRLHST